MRGPSSDPQTEGPLRVPGIWILQGPCSNPWPPRANTSRAVHTVPASNPREAHPLPVKEAHAEPQSRFPAGNTTFPGSGNQRSYTPVPLDRRERCRRPCHYCGAQGGSSQSWKPGRGDVPRNRARPVSAPHRGWLAMLTRPPLPRARRCHTLEEPGMKESLKVQVGQVPRCPGLASPSLGCPLWVASGARVPPLTSAHSSERARGLRETRSP